MHNHIRLTPILLKMFLLITSCFLFAESSVLLSSISSSKLTVGDRVHYTVSVLAPKGITLIPPPHENSFGNIIIKEWNIAKTEREKSDSIAISYVLTTYVPENCTIPELPFILQSADKEDTLISPSIPLQILSVIATADSTIDIQDLKSQQQAGKAPRWWLWVIGTVLGIALLLLGVPYLIRRLRKPPVAPPPKPPYEEALEALGILDGKRYLQKGLIREYVFELSEIFKRYIGRRFDVQAEEFTTEEMIIWLGGSNLETKLRSPVEWFFRTTDPVKFARYIPDEKTIERFDREVRDFLERTRPVLKETTSTVPSETAQITDNTGELIPEQVSATSSEVKQ